MSHAAECCLADPAVFVTARLLRCVSHITTPTLPDSVIMAYLSRNPAAGDTVLGVAQWWLAERAGTWDIATIEQALDRLHAAGHVGRRVLVSGDYYYFGLGASPKDGG